MSPPRTAATTSALRRTTHRLVSGGGKLSIVIDRPSGPSMVLGLCTRSIIIPNSACETISVGGLTYAVAFKKRLRITVKGSESPLICPRRPRPALGRAASGRKALLEDLVERLQHLVRRREHARTRRIGLLGHDHVRKLGRQVGRGGFESPRRNRASRAAARVLEQERPRFRRSLPSVAGYRLEAVRSGKCRDRDFREWLSLAIGEGRDREARLVDRDTGKRAERVAILGDVRQSEIVRELGHAVRRSSRAEI